eukprot:TRINITY_DN4555_c0_g1_i1.p3 TRINITY_DN4555_c0_g1~~TRINITY_DN4555_c0_g1_i1.p3  ORF type:complete len:156 (-),score=21.57 TRINITY_DN4555_c0_g1_i1:39-506(-)
MRMRATPAFGTIGVGCARGLCAAPFSWLPKEVRSLQTGPVRPSHTCWLHSRWLVGTLFRTFAPKRSARSARHCFPLWTCSNGQLWTAVQPAARKAGQRALYVSPDVISVVRVSQVRHLRLATPALVLTWSQSLCPHAIKCASLLLLRVIASKRPL